MENKAKKKNTQTEVLNTNDQSRNAQKEGKHMENNAQKQDTLTEVLKGQKLKHRSGRGASLHHCSLYCRIAAPQAP